MKVKRLHNNEINFIKWDNCIRASVNAMVYAEAWYLDIVCPDWEALVADDYEIVMPICPKRKFLIHYLYQPFFTQQLGLFTPHLLPSDLVDDFLSILPYKFIDINLNYLNWPEAPGFEKINRINYELDLPLKYEKLKSAYSKNTTRNIKKATLARITIMSNTSINSFVEFYKQTIGKKVSELKDSHYIMLRQIVTQSIRNSKGIIYSAYNQHNSLLASAFFLKSPGRVILLAPAVNEEGRKSGAVFKIIDKFIQENAEKAIILDFEGSNIEGIAAFFKGFGATPVNYLQLKKNTLHPIIKIFKN
jgi:hypothetical protein